MYSTKQQLTCTNIQDGPYKKLANVFQFERDGRWYYHADERVRTSQDGGFATHDDAKAEVIRQYESGNIRAVVSRGE